MRLILDRPSLVRSQCPKMRWSKNWWPWQLTTVLFYDSNKFIMHSACSSFPLWCNKWGSLLIVDEMRWDEGSTRSNFQSLSCIYPRQGPREKEKEGESRPIWGISLALIRSLISFSFSPPLLDSSGTWLEWTFQTLTSLLCLVIRLAGRLSAHRPSHLFGKNEAIDALRNLSSSSCLWYFMIIVRRRCGEEKEEREILLEKLFQLFQAHDVEAKAGDDTYIIFVHHSFSPTRPTWSQATIVAVVAVAAAVLLVVVVVLCRMQHAQT